MALAFVMCLLTFLLGGFSLGGSPLAWASDSPDPQLQATAMEADPKAFILGTVNFFLLGFLVYFMIVLKPAQKREEDHKRFLKELKRDDEVVSSSGILGKVVQISQDSIKVDVGAGVKLNFLPEHISPRPKNQAVVVSQKS